MEFEGYNLNLSAIDLHPTFVSSGLQISESKQILKQLRVKKSKLVPIALKRRTLLVAAKVRWNRRSVWPGDLYLPTSVCNIDERERKRTEIGFIG